MEGEDGAAAMPAASIRDGGERGREAGRPAGDPNHLWSRRVQQCSLPEVGVERDRSSSLVCICARLLLYLRTPIHVRLVHAPGFTL